MKTFAAVVGVTAIVATIAATMAMTMVVEATDGRPNSLSDRRKRQDDIENDHDNNDDNARRSNDDRANGRTTEAGTTCDASTNDKKRNPQFSYHPKHNQLYLYHFDETTSTQDEAKIIAEELSARAQQNPPHPPPSFVVTTTSQTNGRGTSGRQWLGAPGNIFVTIGIPQSSWLGLRSGATTGGGSGSRRTGSTSKVVPLTLLPLKVGTEVAQLVHDKLFDHSICHHPKSMSMSPPRVTVKWPNDVLVDEKKVSGTLIESSARGDYFLIGVGINLKYRPNIPVSGPNYGRPAIAFQDFCEYDYENDETSWEELAREWSVQLAYNLCSWLKDNSSTSDSTMRTGVDLAQNIVDGWKKWLDWDMKLTMRDTDNHEQVKLVNVLPDGRVEVEVVDDHTAPSSSSSPEIGRRRTLVSDYFL